MAYYKLHIDTQHDFDDTLSLGFVFVINSTYILYTYDTELPLLLNKSQLHQKLQNTINIKIGHISCILRIKNNVAKC